MMFVCTWACVCECVCGRGSDFVCDAIQLLNLRLCKLTVS